ncbi:MAG: CinA family protein [Clostridia bacterium]|nr:CinA family protein [Clostridia bacterium]
MTAREIVAALAARGETLGCAESLTGGLLSDAIVQVPGASRVFMGGIVAYDEGRKASLLGVRPETLRQYSAVSRQTAFEMAEGARRRLDVDYALATTGYAGPEGEDVGLVYVALAGPGGTETRECRFAGSRPEIRRQAVQAALDLLNIK